MVKETVKGRRDTSQRFREVIEAAIRESKGEPAVRITKRRTKWSLKSLQSPHNKV